MIDVSEALAFPGVVDVITADDVPGDNNYLGEIFYAQNEVCDLYVANYSNTWLKMLRHKDFQRTTDSTSVMLKFILNCESF